MDSIAEKWEELSGKNNWEGLLDPLDIDLRRYLISYGEFSQVCIEAFIWDDISKNSGTSRYAPWNLLAGCGVSHLKYWVTKYIYATFSGESNWIGYVAVATDEGKVELGRRDIVIAWRGTVTPGENKIDMDILIVPAPIIFEVKPPNMHQGFYTYYTSHNEDPSYTKLSAREQVHAEVKKLVEEYKSEEVSITVTGFSLGASLATICAVDLAFNGINKTSDGKEFPVTAFPFACPKVGDSSFGDTFKSVGNLRCLRISNELDVVHQLPPWPYEHVGQNLPIDTSKSPYLKPERYLLDAHNLEIYLHGVAGCKGAGDSFKLVVNRSIELINKMSISLKDEYGIPTAWWTVKNKGIVQNKDGSWVFQDREDYPLTD